MRTLFTKGIPSIRQGDTLVVARDCAISSDKFLMGTVIVLVKRIPPKGFVFYYKIADEQKISSINLENDVAKPRLRFPYKNELKRY